MSRLAMLSLFRQRAGWRRLWAAEALSGVGDWFSIVAVSVLSLGRGGEGVVALALTLGAHLVPQAVLAPVAGLLADRADRRRILIGASLVEGVLTLAMMVAASAGKIGLVQLLLLLRAATSALRPPASGAALPALVKADEIVHANAVSAVTWSVSFALGMALGGVATELSPLVALGIDAFTFFVAAFVLRGLPPLPAPAGESAPAAGTVLAPLFELRAALGIATAPELRAAVFGKMPLAFAAGAGWIALNLVAHAHPDLGGGSMTLGGLQAIRGIGTGVGPVLALSLIARGVRRRRIEHLAAAAGVLGVTGVGVSSGGALAFAVVLIWGSGAGANWVLTTSRIQERAPATFLGRVLALDALLYAVAMSGSALLAALLIDAGFALGPTTLAAAGIGALGWILLGDAPPRVESVEPSPSSRVT